MYFIFMASEGSLSYWNAADIKNSIMVSLDLSHGGRVSSKLVGFFDKPVSLAIPHMVGCTLVVVVVSKKGFGRIIYGISQRFSQNMGRMTRAMLSISFLELKL